MADDPDKPPEQPELRLPFPEFTGDMPLLPARMVNEYAVTPVDYKRGKRPQGRSYPR